MSLQAYQSAAQQAEDPRQLEYRLFGQVTRARGQVAGGAGDDHRHVAAAQPLGTLAVGEDHLGA